MNRFKNAIGIIKACGLNIKGDRKLMEEANQVESTIIEALEKQIADKPKTNYDRIRNMSVEELAKLLDYTNDGDLFVDICAKEYCQEYNNQNLKCSGNCLLANTKYLESECDTE